MTDDKRPASAEAPHFETDFVQTDRAREQGLGLGERELKAQRDPGGIVTPDVDENDEPGEPGVVHHLSDDQPS
jgi:hypothetical protein